MEAGGDIISLKRHGGWKSSAVAEGYLEASISTKCNVIQQIIITGDNKRLWRANAPLILASVSNSNGRKCILSPVAIENRLKGNKRLFPLKKTDYADTAYREAVGRLRTLAESYVPIKRPLGELDSAGEETDNQSLISGGSRNSRIGRTYYQYNPINSRKFNYYPPLRTNYNVFSTETEKPLP
ncbi:hypothetical protein NQ317_004017 [Molorchus minor]|uniref:Uncharacterized protein n=1 Tax=Molorchus minor TaxID=1323400 RepID=A0ABQ9JTW8_9CUCU|nr:hypothetical protein NQ317_004017 [Molorchus minor]